MEERTGYLGPKGSYSDFAARKLKGGATLVAYNNFTSLMNALTAGEVESIVLPVENTLNGGVMKSIDLLQETEGIAAVEEYLLPIDHRLVTKRGADMSRITAVYSHPQALEQCSKYLFENFPNAKQIATNSTAESLGMIKSDSDAGIIGAGCNAEGLCVSDECISDRKTNYTQFLLVVRGSVNEGKPSNKIYFSVTCKHEPGALMSLLSVLDKYKLNMTKIESRPIKDKVGEYRFFIELEGNYAADNVKKALKEVNGCSRSFKLIGAY